MSQFTGSDPTPQGATRRAAVEHVIAPRVSDLGGVMVRRALPAQQTQMIGPFIFFDEFGPAEFLLGEGLDIRPHPHIGLSTVTYLFNGEIMHRDSLGSEMVIRPGELNLMSAGRGIVHSERTPALARTGPAKLYGIQTWMALPKAQEDGDPSFVHHPNGDMKIFESGGARATVIMGEMWGEKAAAKTPTQTIYADVALEAGASLPFDTAAEERGLYVASGAIDIEGDRYEAGRLIVLQRGVPITIRGLETARLMLLGGEPMDGPRFIWWNFVSSKKESMIAAADAWEKGLMPKVPHDEDDFIPMQR